ncbi:DUF2510 domain-containing protein [Streptomyces sp. H27-D2]|uniref:DUF2510 domain-containing protein n=1 Tax=Streptomyces sp. H27-D2 TaxID=3046304 RepID=UPI002DBCC7AF|nr:DUF2510 domain-containing protein [Streptomyces sp. H27-D2]MEC4016642.1 DUF2510 domain-containing protein [Streptomyces sp. H27-D2]
MTTPPGWYPDPGHTGNGPLLERWWDGSAWTDHTRAAQGAAYAPVQQPQQPPPAQQQPGFGPAQPLGPSGAPAPGYGMPPGGTGGNGGGRRRGPMIAAIVGAVVLVAAIVGGVVLLNQDDDSGNEAEPKPSATSAKPSPEEQRTEEPAPTPSQDPNVVEDQLNGITLPAPKDWRQGRSDSGGAGLTKDDYTCPQKNSGMCVRGGVFTNTATGYKADTAEGVAKEDIEQNAEESYGKDPLTEKQMYGGIKSHKKLKSEAVTVAGQKGYLVRWKLDTEKGDGGYVQSVVFPAPTGSQSLVVLRFGFDASDQGPSLKVMDEIVKGVKAIDGGSGDSDTV